MRYLNFSLVKAILSRLQSSLRSHSARHLHPTTANEVCGNFYSFTWIWIRELKPIADKIWGVWFLHVFARFFNTRIPLRKKKWKQRHRGTITSVSFFKVQLFLRLHKFAKKLGRNKEMHVWKFANGFSQAKSTFDSPLINSSFSLFFVL